MLQATSPPLLKRFDLNRGRAQQGPPFVERASIYPFSLSQHHDRTCLRCSAAHCPPLPCATLRCPVMQRPALACTALCCTTMQWLALGWVEGWLCPEETLRRSCRGMGRGRMVGGGPTHCEARLRLGAVRFSAVSLSSWRTTTLAYLLRERE